MTALDWQICSDPQIMLRWLSRQGYMDALWLFTISSTRRFLEHAPIPEFSRVVDLAEQAGYGQASWKMVDECLLDAAEHLQRLKKKANNARTPGEQDRFSREIAVGTAVEVFDFQDGYDAARSISQTLVEWADNLSGEQATQANLLRQLIPDPSQHFEIRDES